jgi:hypothetical protein
MLRANSHDQRLAAVESTANYLHSVMHLTSQTEKTTSTKSQAQPPNTYMHATLLASSQFTSVRSTYIPSHERVCSARPCVPTRMELFPHKLVCAVARATSPHMEEGCAVHLLYKPCMTHCLIFFALWHCPFQTPLPLHRHSHCAKRQNTVYPRLYVEKFRFCTCGERCRFWVSASRFGLRDVDMSARRSGSCDGMRDRWALCARWRASVCRLDTGLGPLQVAMHVIFHDSRCGP